MSVVQYFKSYGFNIDSDQFALSELIQFIFRSAVREGKPIDLYMPNERMKNLLTKWFDSVETEVEDELIE